MSSQVVNLSFFRFFFGDVPRRGVIRWANLCNEQTQVVFGPRLALAFFFPETNFSAETGPLPLCLSLSDLAETFDVTFGDIYCGKDHIHLSIRCYITSHFRAAAPPLPLHKATRPDELFPQSVPFSSLSL